MTTSLLRDSSAAAYTDAMTDVFTAVLRDCALLHLRPTSVHVDYWPIHGFEFRAVVQFSGEDTAAVDDLASLYGADPGPGTVEGNYTREGILRLNGLPVGAYVFTGAPGTNAASDEMPF